MNCSSDGSRRAAISSARASRSRSSPRTYSSSAEVSSAARCSARRDPPQQLVHGRQRLTGGLLPGLLEERGELDQLEIARDRPVHVVGGVEAHLREGRARAPRGLEDLVADHPVGGVKALGRPEDLLVVHLLLGRERAPHRLVERRGARRLPPGLLGPRQHRRARGPADRQVREAAAARLAQLLAGLGQRAGRELGRNPVVLPRRHAHRAGVQAEQVDVVELEALDLPGLGHHDRPGGGRIDVVGGDVAGLGDGGDVAHEVADRPARHPPREVGGELGEAREVDQALSGLRGGREEAVTAHPDPLDQPAHEHVRPHRLHRRRGRALELQERLDPVARLGAELGALERGVERRDHVELAPPRDRRDAGEVGRAQVDRRAGERAHDRGGVVGVGEHPQPGQRVAHLRPLEERRVAGDLNGTLRSSSAAATRRPWRQPGGGDHADPLGQRLAGGKELLDLPRGRLRLGALAAAAPEADAVLVRSAVRSPRRRRAPPGRCRSPRRPRRLRASAIVSAPGCAWRNHSSAHSAAPRKRRMAWCGSWAATRVAREPHSASSSARVRGRGVLQLVGHHVREARADLVGDVGALAQEARRLVAPGRGRRGCRRRAGCGRAARRARRTRSRVARARAAPGCRASRSRAAAQSRSRSALTHSSFSRSIRRRSRASSPAGLPRISCRRSGRSSTRSSRIASRSAAATVVKNGSRPASTGYSRSSRSAISS